MKQILPDLPRPLPVVIDTDPAGGIFLRDIDDVLAIFFLLATPEVRVDALTVTYGNASLDKTFKVAQRIRAFSGRNDLPVLAGASSSRDRGRATPAQEFIVEYFREHAGKAALLTLGPLTNLATALHIEPRLADWIPAVIMMGGNLCHAFPIWPLSSFEFNFAMDARAAESVLSSRLKKWIATTDLCVQAQFGRRQLARLRNLNPHCAVDRLCRIEEWIRVNRLTPGAHGFFPWDPIAAAMITMPQLYEDVREMPLAMRVMGLRSRTIVSAEKDSRVPCMVPMKLRSAEFMDLLIERLSII